MGIRIKSEKDFGRLLDALSDELVEANIHWRLMRDLHRASLKFSLEFNQAPAFWSYTFQAHQDAAMFGLCKVYDDYNGALNLKNFLETVRSNLHVFSEDNFRVRLAGNPFVDSLAADVRTPDSALLQSDLDFVSPETNPQVRNLTGLRNTYFAHRGAREVLAAADLTERFPLKKIDIEELLKRGMAVVNRYGSLFNAVTASTQVVGHDDYKTVLEALRWDIARRHQKIEREKVQLQLFEDWKAVEKLTIPDADSLSS